MQAPDLGDWETVISPFVRARTFSGRDYARTKSIGDPRVFSRCRRPPIARARDFLADRKNTFAIRRARSRKSKNNSPRSLVLSRLLDDECNNGLSVHLVCVLATRFKRLRDSDLPAWKSSNLISLF
jgi:hypothetical protein